MQRSSASKSGFSVCCGSTSFPIHCSTEWEGCKGKVPNGGGKSRKRSIPMWGASYFFALIFTFILPQISENFKSCPFSAVVVIRIGGDFNGYDTAAAIQPTDPDPLRPGAGPSQPSHQPLWAGADGATDALFDPAAAGGVGGHGTGGVWRRGAPPVGGDLLRLPLSLSGQLRGDLGRAASAVLLLQKRVPGSAHRPGGVGRHEAAL